MYRAPRKTFKPTIHNIQEYRFSLTRIVDSALLRENTRQRKPASLQYFTQYKNHTVSKHLLIWCDSPSLDNRIKLLSWIKRQLFWSRIFFFFFLNGTEKLHHHHHHHRSSYPRRDILLEFNMHLIVAKLMAPMILQQVDFW